MAGFFSLTNHEIYLVGARDGARDNAMIATWVIPATLATGRMRLVVALSVSNLTTEMIASTGRFALQMLADDQLELLPRLGLPSGRDVDKLAGLSLARTPAGLPVAEGGCGWAECEVVGRLDSGDRVITLADVVAQRDGPGRAPLRKVAAFERLPAEVVAQLRDKQRAAGLRDAELLRELR